MSRLTILSLFSNRRPNRFVHLCPDTVLGDKSSRMSNIETNRQETRWLPKVSNCVRKTKSHMWFTCTGATILSPKSIGDAVLRRQGPHDTMFHWPRLEKLSLKVSRYCRWTRTLPEHIRSILKRGRRAWNDRPKRLMLNKLRMPRCFVSAALPVTCVARLTNRSDWRLDIQ
jgi:hypothetical protein